MNLARIMLLCTALLPFAAYGEEAQRKIAKTAALSAAITKVQPEYPPIARQMKLQGTVELEAFINEEGTVDKVTVVTGNLVLSKAAQEAARQWKFKPFTDEGKPVKAVAVMSFTFNP